MDILLRLRTYAVRAAAGIVVVAAGTSTTESYMGLRSWALAHGTIGAGSWIFPGMIDTFPLLGEIMLFVAMIDRWSWKAKVLPWLVITGGLVVSVALNTGHLISADVYTKLTQGLPPVAAWVSLVTGMVMFELIMRNRPVLAEVVSEVIEELPKPEPAPEPDTQDEEQNAPDDELHIVRTPGPDLHRAALVFAKDLQLGRVPGLNRIRATVHCGHKNAPIIQKHLEEMVERRELELTA